MDKFKRAIKIISDYRLPKLLTANNVQLSEDEKAAVAKQTAVERQWYGGIEPFETTAGVLAAAQTGRLVPVSSTADYTLIMRLRNPKLIGEYPAYLTKEAAGLLNEITAEWRRRGQEAGIRPAIKLSVTSLLRTNPYQQLIVQAGKLAMPDSPHTRGEAFDIDGSGYYDGDTPINARADRQDEWRQAFQEIGAAAEAPDFGDYSSFDPQVPAILRTVLDDYKAAGKLNYVLEYAGTTNACFHVCRNPDYQPSQHHLR